MRSLGYLYHSGMELEFDIAAWVKEARTHWGQSQEALGDWLGKTKGNISAWEKGRHEPSFKQVLQIAAITGYALPPGMGIKVADAAANDVYQLNADELINIITAYKYATPAEREAFLSLSGRILKRKRDPAEKPAGN